MRRVSEDAESREWVEQVSFVILFRLGQFGSLELVKNRRQA